MIKVVFLRVSSEATAIKAEGRGFESHPGLTFSLALCGLTSLTSANGLTEYTLRISHHHNLLFN